MKKFILFLATIASLSPFGVSSKTSSTNRASTDDAIQYAQIITETYLYKKDDDDTFSKISTLPASYFVALTGDMDSGGDTNNSSNSNNDNSDDENSPTDDSQYIKASYLDIDGYVLASDIDIVDFEPVTKHFVGQIEINNPDISGVNLRYVPDHSDADNIIDQITKQNTDLVYYGTVIGSKYNGSDTWYYVRTTLNGKVEHGYVYGANMQCTPIPENIIEAVPKHDEKDELSTSPTPISDTTLYIVIAILCVPVVVIMTLMFKKKSVPRLPKPGQIE